MLKFIGALSFAIEGMSGLGELKGAVMSTVRAICLAWKFG